MMFKEKRFSGKTFDMANIGVNEITDNNYQIEKPILIVGRDYENRLLLKTLLELWKYRTIESPTVGEAENLTKNCLPKLILLDTTQSFSETLENIYFVRQTKSLSALPLIVISGYSQANYRNLALAGGANGYLIKPLNFAYMERALEKFFGDGNIAQEANL